jgi:hypothetical protein
VRRVLIVLAAAVVLVPGASAQVLNGPTPYRAPNTAPTGLHAFLLTPNEGRKQYYPRTPSFAWVPVAQRGGSYDFELATSRTFNDSAVLFSYTKLKIPALSIAHQLPWMTGVPYALWAHVRWESADGKHVTPWSQPFGFNMRWTDSDYPEQLPAPEGLIRWKPIEGATRYEVLYPDIAGTTAFQTTTNVADEREFFTFHTSLGWSTIHWRVRAIRYIDDKDLLRNGLPRVSYGPWSKVFATVNPPQSMGVLRPTDTVSDTWDKPGAAASPHELTPAFAWQPASPLTNPYIGAVGSSLYRVYIFTDDHCVNVVFKGSVVGSPAFAARTIGGPFALPQSQKEMSKWNTPPYLFTTGDEGHSFDAAGALVKPNELPGSKVSQAGSTTASGSPGGVSEASVDLWDSGWPNGRYYWTVVPVRAEPYGAPDVKTSDQPVEYHDTAVPQDQCEVGNGMSFGKVSQPVVTQAGTPWVSGLSPDGRVVASAKKVPEVHDSPLVAWEPAVGATTYEVQLSRLKYPWRTTWSSKTAATSAVLPLGKAQVGTWWYRVRGINPALPDGAQAMSWSAPVRLRVTGDSFVVVK